MAAATRAAPLCAGRRPRRSPSPQPSPRPRLPRGEGSPRRRGPSGREQTKLSLRWAFRLYGNLRPRGAGLTLCLKGGGGGGAGASGCPWASGPLRDDPERSWLSLWWRTRKKLSRDSSDSSNSPKGQTIFEHFRECTPTRVGASLPTCGQFRPQS